MHHKLLLMQFPDYCIGDFVINTDNKSVQQIVDEMKVIVDSEGRE